MNHYQVWKDSILIEDKHADNQKKATAEAAAALVMKETADKAVDVQKKASKVAETEVAVARDKGTETNNNNNHVIETVFNTGKWSKQNLRNVLNYYTQTVTVPYLKL